MVKPKLRILITEKNSWLLALNAYLLISTYCLAKISIILTYIP